MHPPSPLHVRTFCDRPASTIGIGACRESGPENPAAIALAIGLGCNVVDTAPHYHQGAHERAVGEAIRDAVAAGAKRDALIVSTKVGRVPELLPNNKVTLGFARLRAFIEDSYISRGLFAWDDLAHSDHTFAPAYLRHSIERSLERLGLDRIDCVFLEAPEVQRRVVGPSGFARRMFAAFETLEGLCAAGRIGCYGIATGAELDLALLAGLARTAAGSGHHLRALQIRLSLLRQEPRASGLLDRAAELGLFVYAHGCLDGGAPAYQIPDELAATLGDLPDAGIAIRWAQSAPRIGTALFGARDPRHVRANLAAARLPLLDAALYAEAGAA